MPCVDIHLRCAALSHVRSAAGRTSRVCAQTRTRPNHCFHLSRLAASSRRANAHCRLLLFLATVRTMDVTAAAGPGRVATVIMAEGEAAEIVVVAAIDAEVAVVVGARTMVAGVAAPVVAEETAVEGEEGVMPGGAVMATTFGRVRQRCRRTWMRRGGWWRRPWTTWRRRRWLMRGRRGTEITK